MANIDGFLITCIDTDTLTASSDVDFFFSEFQAIYIDNVVDNINKISSIPKFTPICATDQGRLHAAQSGVSYTKTIQIFIHLNIVYVNSVEPF